MDSVDKLLNEFSDLLRKDKGNLPYHFNLLDAIGVRDVRETAHSRILARFLGYKSPEGDFEILRSWLDDIRDRFPLSQNDQSFPGFKMESPMILVEHNRIDILITDKSYAIIVENKSNWAVDQNAQLSRYIEAVRKRYENEQIFVLYLPPNDSKEPTDKTWSVYKKDFVNRYAKLSWQDDIIPWLTERVLPNVRRKDAYLVSALEQYIDHWDGRCGKRNVDHKMNAALKAFVVKKLEWVTDEASTRLVDLSETIQKIQASLPKLRELEDPIRFEAADKLNSVLRWLGNQTKRDLEAKFWNELHDELSKSGYEVERRNLTPDSILQSYRESGWYDVGLQISFKVEGTAHPFYFRIVASKGAGYYGFLFMSEDGSGKPVASQGPRNDRSRLAESCATDAMPKCKAWPSWYGCAVDKSFWFRGIYLKDVAVSLGEANRRLLVQKLARHFDGCIKKFSASAEKRGLKLLSLDQLPAQATDQAFDSQPALGP
jgi:hypothetical protein